MSWWNGTEEFWEKSKAFGSELQMPVFVLDDFYFQSRYYN